MLERGAFKDVDLCMMAHPSNCDAVYGHWLALAVLTVEFFGKSAHASAEPWKGINALDAAVSTYNSLSLLRLPCTDIDSKCFRATDFIASS
jgi:metal-dependent amidase/aminoacylase/carboxypeptidase family protein